MELRTYLAILRRRWWLLLLGAAIAAAVAYGYSKHQTPLYRAEATLLLNLAAQPSTPTSDAIAASQALTKTYAQIITARSTLEEAARRLGVQSVDGVSGTDVTDTELLKVSFANRDPAFAAKVVNTVSEVFAQRVRESQLGSTDQQGPAVPSATPATAINTIYILDAAIAPGKPFTPRTRTNTLLAAAAGLLVAAGLVALLEYLDDSIKDLAQLQSLGLLLMGTIRRHSPPKGGRLSVLSADGSHGVAAEEYRQLRTNIEFATLDGDVRSLVITSAQPGEGKTTTACNLAIMLARVGKRVILVDADLRKPAVHSFFGLPNQRGLTSVMLAQQPDAEQGVLQHTELASLRILSSGPLPPNPAELLASHKMTALLARLAAQADIVVYDLPPSMAVADAAILAAQADAVLLVVTMGDTSIHAVRSVVDQLGRSKTRLLGVVLNKVTRRGSGKGYYYSPAGYSSHPNGASAAIVPETDADATAVPRL